MLLANHILIPLTICKKSLKRFSKSFAKQEVQIWSKILNKSKPFILSNNFNWFKLQVTYAHSKCKLVTFLDLLFALVCVGINHQKGGD
jgi:hypothetical protein